MENMTAISKSKHNILLAEDDTVLSETLTETLSDAGFQIISVKRPFEAIQKLQNQVFQCVILDLHLEKGNGTKIIEFIRQTKNQNRDVPIIVMSGAMDREIILQIRKHVTHVFVKPFGKDELLLEVQNALNRPSV